jgi:aspartate 1-decarboxylase
MERILLKSKIHRATVTEADLHYEGSISIDPALLGAADILDFEQVQVYNVTNGNRFTTYAIRADRPGQIKVNGAAAHLAKAGDLVIVATYAGYSPREAARHRPIIVHVDRENRMAPPADAAGAPRERPARARGTRRRAEAEA